MDSSHLQAPDFLFAVLPYSQILDLLSDDSLQLGDTSCSGSFMTSEKQAKNAIASMHVAQKAAILKISTENYRDELYQQANKDKTWTIRISSIAKSAISDITMMNVPIPQ